MTPTRKPTNMLSINQFIPVNQAAKKSSTLQSTFRKHLAVINEWWYCWCFRNPAITTCYLWNPYETCDILHINWWTPDFFHQHQRIHVWFIYLKPANDLYFRRTTPQNTAFSNQNKGHLGSRYLPTFGWFYGKYIGNYTIHGSYGNHIFPLPTFF